jgi:hypothetical protein
MVLEWFVLCRCSSFLDFLEFISVFLCLVDGNAAWGWWVVDWLGTRDGKGMEGKDCGCEM